uniref:Uncharacterized protein n=1 Tax=Panagrolaimus superbus TaxID=310955 RepID=A0A914Z7D8_9BILA
MSSLLIANDELDENGYPQIYSNNNFYSNNSLNRQPFPHRYKIEGALTLLGLLFIGMIVCVNKFVVNPLESHYPNSYLDPCNVPNVTSVKSFFKLQYTVDELQRKINGIDTTITLDIPQQFSKLLLDKRKNLNEEYSTKYQKLNYQKLHRTKCYETNIKHYFSEIHDLRNLIEAIYLIGAGICIFGVSHYIREAMKIDDLSQEQLKFYGDYKCGLKFLSIIHVLFVMIFILDVFYFIKVEKMFKKGFPLFNKIFGTPEMPLIA